MHAVSWLAVLAHWFHVIAGIMWIGASFYLISWENKFNRSKGLREGIEGNFWTIQGGDFYYVEKLKKAPARLPEELHWFKYEAYLTWLSGFVLLCLVFYLNAGAMMVDTSVADIRPGAAVAIGLGVLLLSWLLYRLYCRTSWARNFPLSAVVGLLCLAVLSYGLTSVFSQRAAFIHVGAIMGTLMSGNVFFVIIPWHKALIRAIEAKQPLDPLFARHPGFLSRHNHYMTLPVIFIMLSGHFPIAVDQPLAWLLLPAIAAFGGLLKHYHNMIQKRRPSLVYLLASLALLAVIVIATDRRSGGATSCAEAVSFDRVYDVVATRCVSCHSAAPTDVGAATLPSGLHFDKPAQILAMKDRIMARAVIARTMPPGNRTGMTPAERQDLGCWIEAGAAFDGAKFDGAKSDDAKFDGGG